MQKIRLILANNNMEFCSLVRDYIAMVNDIELICVAKDGLEALRMVKQEQPDILVLSSVMPNLDGIGVLSVLAGLENVIGFKRPKVITISAYISEDFMIKAYKLGVDYQMYRIINIEELVMCLHEVADKSTNKNVKISSTTEIKLLEAMHLG